MDGPDADALYGVLVLILGGGVSLTTGATRAVGCGSHPGSPRSLGGISGCMPLRGGILYISTCRCHPYFWLDMG